mgnify:CR=1 FL=1
MDDSYCLLPERISEQFSEIDSDIVMDLAAASPKYTELKAQMEELKRRNPVIGALLEGKGELSFTAEEHEAFIMLCALVCSCAARHAVIIMRKACSIRSFAPGIDSL